MKKKIYIIGSALHYSHIDNSEYYAAYIALVEMGFHVSNPIISFTDNTVVSIDELKRKNIRELLFSDAVYILPSIDINSDNIEIKLAVNFKLTIITSIINLNQPSKIIIESIEKMSALSSATCQTSGLK